MRVRPVIIPVVALGAGFALQPVPETPKEAKLQIGQMCGTAQVMRDRLNAGFDETMIHGGTSTQFDTEVWANPDTGSFTVLAIIPGGAGACIIAAGENFDGARPKEGEPA